jgi:phosphopantothenoylcysteine decarboxylase/phosphopantothenate--cysteine ligase
MSELRDKRILLCVGGGIAAYKACEVARLLVKAGAELRVAMTPAAQQFVTPLTFQALTGRAPATSLFDAAQELAAGHIALADSAELAICAPATADLLARLRLGAADDLVTATLLAIPPNRWLLAPAMNEKMWSSPATEENVAALKDRGANFVGPAVGEMAERSHTGLGRLVEAAGIIAAAQALLGSESGKSAPGAVQRDLEGVPVLITAGPTREHLDPVRFLSNPSTGRMGFALAEAARDRGAQVILVAGATEIPPPQGVEVVRATTAEQMSEAVQSRAGSVRAVIMAAAVSDQRPAGSSPQKVKKREGEELLRLVRTPDILASLGARFANEKVRPLLIGFAAETESLEEHARGKLVRKQLDLIVANDVSGADAGFAAEENRVVVLSREGTRDEFSGPKRQVADEIWNLIRARLSSTSSS